MNSHMQSFFVWLPVEVFHIRFDNRLTVQKSILVLTFEPKRKLTKNTLLCINNSALATLYLFAFEALFYIQHLERYNATNTQLFCPILHTYILWPCSAFSRLVGCMLKSASCPYSNCHTHKWLQKEMTLATLKTDAGTSLTQSPVAATRKWKKKEEKHAACLCAQSITNTNSPAYTHTYPHTHTLAQAHTSWGVDN